MAVTLTFSDSYISDHATTARGRLLYQFCNSPNIKAFLDAFTNRIQEFEDAFNPLVLSRNLDLAVGDVLDALGEAVGAERGGRGDDAYRVFIRGTILANTSNGTGNELIQLLSVMAGQDSPDVILDEYDPDTIYIRARNVAVTETAIFNDLLQRAKAAGFKLFFIYSPSAGDDDNVFRYSATGDTPELSSTKGFNMGLYTGVLD